MKAFALLPLLLCPVVAQAETSRELAQKSRVAWSAFECAFFAERMRKPEEQARLFELGYKDGIAFIKALKAEKIEVEDLHSTTPIGFSMRLNGPSADFSLGRVFEGAADEAAKKLFVKERYDEALHELNASNAYSAANCALLR